MKKEKRKDVEATTTEAKKQVDKAKSLNTKQRYTIDTL